MTQINGRQFKNRAIVIVRVVMRGHAHTPIQVSLLAIFSFKHSLFLLLGRIKIEKK